MTSTEFRVWERAFWIYIERGEAPCVAERQASSVLRVWKQNIPDAPAETGYVNFRGPVR